VLTLDDLAHLAKLIRLLARSELLPRFTHTSTQFKADGSVITEADLAMQQQLQTTLLSHWPSIPLLGEEMPEQQQQQLLSHKQAAVWIVDPLDGTSNYSNGLPFFSVSVALLYAGQIHVGVVYDPIRDECFSALRGQGAWLNNTALSLRTDPQPSQLQVGIVDYKRLPVELATRLATHPPYKSQRSFGSVALDWCWLACGRAQVYVHGKQNLWDYAAGSLVLAEAGGYACTLQGEVVYNGSLQPRSAVAAVNQSCFDEWCQYLGITPQQP
jgi:myo-inositol-1(or 4)-monophosphatase